jgi:hypothetical protein
MSTFNSFNDISLEEYSERSIVVRGDTRKYKEDLKKLGGKYNARLSGEPGWIFSKRQQADVEKFISSGERIVSEQEAQDGESRTQSFEREKQTSKTPTSFQTTTKSQTSNISLEMQRMSSRIDSLENLVKQLMSLNNKEPKSPRKITKVIKIMEPSDDSDVEESSKPMKRLLQN